MSEIRNHATLIWGIAELLRGDYKQSQYGDVILPLIVMRRLDQVLEPTRDLVITRGQELEASGVENVELALRRIAGQQFFNRHRLRFHQLLDDPGNIADHLRSYIDGYSALARQVVEKFDFDKQIDRLKDANLLYKVIARVCDVDLHPDRVSNAEMGSIFEEIIRRFAEASNETAGEHFTPREVVQLMVNLLLDGDEEVLREPGAIRTVFDCACGTGGMLSEAESQIHCYNDRAVVRLYGQELNPQSYAICLADMLVKGQDATHIVHGNSLSEDGHKGERFHYCIANPPFGVDWSKVEEPIRDEHETLGFDGRFGAGLPRKSDGQLLFLMHLISKMREAEDGGTRIAIVHNGSPLFTGGAGSNESNIRKWILENDWLEAIVALPEQLFYNTGIASYVWLLSNRKAPERQGVVQLIDAREMWERMRKSLGEKRRCITDEQVAEITRLHGSLDESDVSKLIPVEQFGYRTITVDRPLRARWEIGPNTWDRLADDKALAKLDPDTREAVVAELEGTAQRTFQTEDGVKLVLRETLASAGVSKPPTQLLKVLIGRCMVRDPDAEPVQDARGRVVPDPELRDNENVPLAEGVSEYMARRVLPHLPDAFVTEPAGTIGYSIPVAQHFVRQLAVEPPTRDPAEVFSDLQAALEEFTRCRAAIEALAAEMTCDRWPDVPLKYVARTGSGHTPSRARHEFWVPDELVVPWFTLADIGQLRAGRQLVVTETSERVSRIGIANSAAVEHPAGTVLLSRTASVGFSGVMGVPMAVSQDFMTWTCGPRLDPFFLALVLRARRPELLNLMYGSTHKTIYMPDLLALTIKLPPIGEQRRIVDAARQLLDRTWALADEAAELNAVVEQAGVASAAHALLAPPTTVATPV